MTRYVSWMHLYVTVSSEETLKITCDTLTQNHKKKKAEVIVRAMFNAQAYKEHPYLEKVLPIVITTPSCKR